METVDRFGDWHHPIGLEAREQFWKDGIDMTSRKEFRPECTVQHVRLIGLNAAVVQVMVFYHDGIALKGADRISAFSEIHTLFLATAEGRWLISAQDNGVPRSKEKEVSALIQRIVPGVNEAQR